MPCSKHFNHLPRRSPCPVSLALLPPAALPPSALDLLHSAGLCVVLLCGLHSRTHWAHGPLCRLHSRTHWAHWPLRPSPSLHASHLGGNQCPQFSTCHRLASVCGCGWSPSGHAHLIALLPALSHRHSSLLTPAPASGSHEPGSPLYNSGCWNQSQSIPVHGIMLSKYPSSWSVPGSSPMPSIPTCVHSSAPSFCCSQGDVKWA